MHRITLLCVGRLKEQWARDGAMQYVDRLHTSRFEVIELLPSRAKDAGSQRAEESDRLHAQLEKLEGVVWALDETGDRFTSPDFSQAIEQLRDRGDHLIVVLGGAYGLIDLVLKRADRIVRLSDMTLPHELCRVLLMEQLYRAQEITKGTGYHHR